MSHFLLAGVQMTEPLDINDIPSLMERVSRLMAGTRWQTRLRNHFRELFTPAAKRNRMTDLQYIAKAEPQRLGVLSLFAFDNFMTLRYGKNGELNFVETFMRNISGVSSDFYLSKQLELYEVVRTSRLTVYEVVQVTRDETFVVRDLIYGGDDIAIEYSPTLTQMLEIWDCIAGRVVEFDGAPFLCPSFLWFDQKITGNFLEKLQEMIADKRKQLMHKENLSGDETAQTKDEEILSQLPMAILMADAWNEAIDERGELRFGLPPPTLGTVEGGIVEICEVTFRVGDDLESIAARLDRIDRLCRVKNEDHQWYWAAPVAGLADYLQAISQSEPYASQDKFTRDDTGTMEWLGLVELSREKLTLWTSSKPRAQAGKKLLGSQLGERVSNPMFTYTNSHEETKHILDSITVGINELTLPEVLTSMHSGFRFLYYEDALDTPSRDYDGMTPRQMARSLKHRRKALEWLKMRECTDRRICKKNDLDLYDFTWMWKELGFDRSRHLVS